MRAIIEFETRQIEFDCPEVVQKLREKAFVYEEMDKAVAEYNSCQ